MPTSINPTTDRLTVLTSLDGVATKTFHSNGLIEPYRAGKRFFVEERECSSLSDLFRHLRSLESCYSCLVIRGALIAPVAIGQQVKRRSNGPSATFKDVPRNFVMLDIDGVPVPAGIDPTSAEALARVVALLPPEFRNVSFIAQWSSSAGLKPGVIKVHLWFWLETPRTSAELRAWANRLPCLANGKPLIDPAVFNPVQPHYTARPIFDGVTDPVPHRTLHVELEKDSVQLDIGSASPLAVLHHPISASRRTKMTGSNHKTIDGREAQLMRLRYAILRDERPSSCSEFVRLTWERFDNECETGPTSASSNTYTKESIAAKCEYDWETFQRGEFDFQKVPFAVLAPFPERTVPLNLGLAQLQGAIQGYLEKPEHTALRITSGSGKTSTLCEELVKALRAARNKGTKKVAHFYLTTHNLKDEIANRLHRLDPKLRVRNVVGRVPATCSRYELTSSLREFRLPIQRVCCDASRAKGMEGSAFTSLMKCPHFDTCAYQQQFDEGADVYLFTKQYLQASRRSDVAPPDYVIIDEEFIASLVEVRETGLEDLLKVPLQTSFEARRALQVVRDALAMGKPVLAQLREAGFDAASLRQRALDISLHRSRRLGLNVLPGMSATDIAAQATSIGPENLGYLVLKALAVEMEHLRDDAYSVVYRDSKLVVRLLRESEVFTCPTLVLDATADEELIRAVLPSAKFRSIDVPRRALVTQVRNRRLSRHSLTKAEGQDQTRALAQQSPDRITRRYARGLLVTFKSHTDAFTLPAGWSVAHYGAIRGLDQYKECDTVVLVGTYLPPVQPVENEAGALAARLPGIRKFSGNYVELQRPFRLREGDAAASIWGHPDEVVQRVLEQKREAEMLQAVDRLRLVHALHPKPVFVLSNLPLDLTVDELVTLEQLAGPDDYLGQLLDHLGGVVPLRAGLLHDRRPDLFPSEKAAEKWAAPYTPKPLISSIRQTGVKELRAKAIGQRGPSDTRILVRGDHPAPRAAVEHHLGELSSYDGPPDREVATFVTVPGTRQTVGARIVQFVDADGRAPLGWKPSVLPPDLYRVLNPPLVQKPHAT